MIPLSSLSVPDLVALYDPRPRSRDILPPQLSIAAPVQQPEQVGQEATGRTWGEMAGDVGAGVLKGGLGMATGLANLADLATFGAVSGIAKGVGGLADRALGGTGEGYTLQEGANRIDEGIAALESDPLRQRRQQMQDRLAEVGQQGGISGGLEKLWASAKETATDPTLLGQMLAEQIPLLATMGAGTVGTAGRASNAARAVGPTLPGVAEGIGARAATRANIGFSGALGAGYSSQQAAQDVLRASPEQMAASPEYRALVESGLSDRDARAKLAFEAGYPAAAIAGPASALTAGITAPLETAAFLGQLPRGIGQVAGAMGREALEEIPQESSEQIGTNVGVRQAGIERGLWEGVPESAGAAGVAGGLIGAGLSGVNVAMRPRVPGKPDFSPPTAESGEATAPAQAPGLAEAPTGLNEPLSETGPISRAANLGIAAPVPMMAALNPPATDPFADYIAQQGEANLGQQRTETAPRPDDSIRPEPAVRAQVGDVAQGAVDAAATPPAEAIAPLVSGGASSNSKSNSPQPTKERSREERQAETEALLNEAPSTLGGLAVQELPLDRLSLSEDVPQFKSGANEQTGVVEPLGGKYERVGTAPIIVWERADGRQEVISGRHRLDLARRSGETSIPAQVLREADGFDARQASILDAELNIRDGQGKVKDYVKYFQHAGLTQEEANLRGLVSRSVGQRAFAIANEGSPGLIASHRADQLTDDAAWRIAKTAPRDERLQSVGIKAIQDGKSIAAATNLMQAVKSMGVSDTTGDMFGFDDSAMKQAEAMGKAAERYQRRLSEQLAAVQGAAKRPEQARALGVDVADPAAVRAKIADLKAERDAWENWSTNPDLVARIRAEVAPAPAPAAEAPLLSDYSKAELQAEQERLASVQAQEKAANQAADKKAEADRARNDFMLTGSDRSADVAMARGQESMFSRGDGRAANPTETARTLADHPEVIKLGERVAVVERQAELRPELQPKDGGPVKAVIDGNRIVLVGEHWTAEDLANMDGVLQHEGGVHLARDSGFYDPQVQAAGKVLRAVGLKSLAGDASWSDVTQQLDALRKNGNASVRKAFDAAERAGTSPERLHEEALGYLAELNPKHSFIRRLVATVKAALYRMGVRVKLGDAELVALARIGLKQQARPQSEADGKAGDEARYSRAGVWTESLPADVRSMAEKIGADPKPLRERLAAMRENLGTRIRQGAVDRFARLLDNDRARFGQDALDTDTALSAWVAAKMSKSPEGALEAAFLHGRLKWEDGAINVQETGRGLAKALEPVAKAGELNRFWQWIIAHRSERLMSEGRERLFTASEIAAGKRLNEGAMADGSSRNDVYRSAFARYRVIQKSILDIAQEAGLFNAQQRGQWEHDFYLPFYRVIDDEGAVRGPSGGGKLVRQKAFEKLNGGTEKLGDPLQNILKNWHHLIDASLKNRAAGLALDTAEALGIADQVPEAQTDKNSVWVLRDGSKVHYSVSDPLTLEAVSALSAPWIQSGVVKTLAAFKRALTVAVTTSPAFKARNLLRDSIAALVVSKLSPNAFGNIANGIAAAKDGSPTQAALLAGGGIFRLGTMLEGDPRAAARRIAGWQPDTVLDSPAKIRGLYDLLKKGVDGWNRFGDRLESANRAALYDQLRKEGKTHLQAALAARDLMDFAQSGGWPAVRFLTAVVPFLNARIQGLDVLYRKGFKPLGKALSGNASAGERQQAARFAATTFAVSLASALLYLAYKDDEEFKRREQWDRDTYWWFKVGDTPYRIPKPFEVGALGTIAERLVEQLADQEAGGELFSERMGFMLRQTFSVDPVPQMVRPLLNVYANQDPFTRRPIETMDMERLSPEMRRRSDTSALAVGLSEAGLGKAGLSPVQIEHLMRGYFGWIGAQALLVGDMVARPALGLPERPAKTKDLPVVGDLIQSFAPDGRGSRYVTEFYEQLKVLRQVHADAMLLRKLGDTEGLKSLVANRGKELAQSQGAEAAARAMAELGQAERAIAESRSLGGTEKQARIDVLARQKEQIARRMRAALAL